jgi:putative DNA primase/helicase
LAGCKAADILKALKSGGLIEAGAAEGHVSVRSAAAEGSRGAALRIWSEARSIAGTPAAAYLAARGLDNESAELRYHARAPHGPGPMTRYRPALIAAVRDESGLVGVHRTFIDPARRELPGVAGAKCGLGRFGGGAVRLGGAAPRLGLSEGIETALSATALFGVPCWAALGTERFRHVELAPETRELLLFVDHDASGRRAEALARETFRHLAIEVHRPGARGRRPERRAAQDARRGGRGRRRIRTGALKFGG